MKTKSLLLTAVIDAGLACGVELRSRRQIAGERMGIRGRPERKVPQDVRREKITENC
jgi:hypothetical protein